MYRIPLFLVLFVLSVSPVFAQPTARDVAREQKIVDELEQIAPSEVEHFKAATLAMDSNLCVEASKLFDKVLTHAPEFEPALRRQGYCLADQGKIVEGRGLIQYAVDKTRSPENLMSLAQILAYPPPRAPQPSKADQQKALKLVTEALSKVESDDNDPSYLSLQAALAAELQDEATFNAATDVLAARYPNEASTHYFLAIRAAHRSSWSVAEDEILKAEKAGLPHEIVEQFLASGVHSSKLTWEFVYIAVALVTIWVLGLVTLLVVGKLMSKVTLRSIENCDPNLATSSSELRLRKVYRFLINLGGIYYYISIPVVMFLVLAVAASVTYAFWMIGTIPIKIVGILVIGALITVYMMGKSLFLKLDDEEPGRSLTVTEAPGLWELTRKVATAVQTRPIDEIRVTPGTDLAVYERGSMREKRNQKSKRVLLLGVGVLDGFQLNSFRAVLAHEYGHFSNRDTAGGEVALRVNADMMKFAHAMYASGQAVKWNVAFTFLRVFHFIFRRLSHGATRLQEVLADRVSAMKFGAQAFEDGLKHVIKKSAEFEFVALKEVNESVSAKRALQNLYELSITANPDIDEAIKTSLTRQTTEDDTHPSPEDRFRLVRKVRTASELPLSGVVWDLFADRAAITAEMTAKVQSNVRG